MDYESAALTRHELEAQKHNVAGGMRRVGARPMHHTAFIAYRGSS
jgi:hypothetical protein